MKPHQVLSILPENEMANKRVRPANTTRSNATLHFSWANDPFPLWSLFHERASSRTYNPGSLEGLCSKHGKRHTHWACFLSHVPLNETVQGFGLNDCDIESLWILDSLLQKPCFHCVCFNHFQPPTRTANCQAYCLSAFQASSAKFHSQSTVLCLNSNANSRRGKWASK